jgi:RNA polymerase sigma-70 factor (ECF subfamily)
MTGGQLVPLRRASPVAAEPEADDAALVCRAQAGELEARGALVRRHLRRVVGLAHRLAPELDAEDLAHDAFVRMLSGLPKLKTPAAFSGWLSSIVVAEVRSRLRQGRVRRRLGLVSANEAEPSVAVSAEAPAPLREAIIDLYRSLSALDDEERLALVLQRVEGWELEEIATRMALSVATVKRRLAAAQTKLMGASHA